MNKNDIRLLTCNNLYELHYVSSVPDKTCKNKSKLTYLKIKLLETDDQKETRLLPREEMLIKLMIKKRQDLPIEEKHMKLMMKTD